MLERLLRIPRSRWLGLALIVLVTASIFWYWRLQTWDPRQAAQIGHSPALRLEWWIEPVVYNPDAALPELSGRLFGVAVQKVQEGDRIWVVGAKGFLAYSDDGAQCWTRFDYHPDQGVFRAKTQNPCAKSQASQHPAGTPTAFLHWPLMVPTVYAGEAPFRSSPRPQSQSSAHQSSAQQGPAQKRSPVEQTSDQQGVPAQQNPNSQQVQQPTQQEKESAQRPPETKSPIWVNPKEVDFGAVVAPSSAAQSPSGKSSPITVSNLLDRPLRIRATAFSGNEAGEFELDGSKCAEGIEPKKSCTVMVLFRPRTDGKKEFGFSIETDYSSAPEKVSVHALASGFSKAVKDSGQPSASDRPPSKREVPTASPARVPTLASGADSSTRQIPKRPDNAPDLLVINFESGGGRIVSTGGAMWAQDSNGDWLFEPQLSGDTVRLGNLSWTFRGPAEAWDSPPGATETWVETVDSLGTSEAAPYLFNLRWDKNRPGTQTSWQSGATTKEQVTAWPDSHLQSIAIDSHRRGWVAGWSSDARGEHAVLANTANGTSWQFLTRGALPAERRDAAANSRAWMWMPRWYLAMLVLSLTLSAPALLRPLPVTPPDSEQDSVEGRLSSDKPLDPGDRDVLGLTEIAIGLSAFLRNEKTLPPLTVAINGEWGTGKSSLMNLLRCDLESYGMHPVWFNAWHHQKEEHLLAALLQTIKLEAVPPLWNLLGVPFRARLIAYRLRRSWPMLVMAAAAATFLVMLDYHFRIHDQKDLFQWVINQIVPSVDVKSKATTTLPVQGGAIAILTAITALWKGMTAFGANPASLLASVAQGNKMKDLEAQTSFRQRFAEEFRDFTNALGNDRPLVIFIDDLDRCLPANVRDVLEAVNFLVSSGDCFVVLGMDRVQVQRAVGLSFKDVAEEASSNHTQRTAAPGAALTPLAIAEAAAETAREKRAEFAQKYLEKLVNLEIRVPRADDDDVKQGLFAKDPPTKLLTVKERSLQVGLKILRWGIPAALVALLFWGSYHYSLSAAFAAERWIEENPASDLTPPPAANPKPGSGATSAGQTKPPVTQSAVDAQPSKLERKTEIVTPLAGNPPKLNEKAVWPARWMLSLPLYLGAVFLLLVGNVVLTTRPGVVTHDSQQFTDALGKVWYPLVLEKQNTPRAAKRFVNRLRYLAMRQRYYRAEDSVWQRTLFPRRLTSPERSQKPSRIPEPIMIALAAMEQSDEAWVNNPMKFNDIIAGKDLLDDILASAREHHINEFANSSNSQWTFLPNFREPFLKIWPPLSAEEQAE